VSARLLIASGPLRKSGFHLDASPLTIGRDPGNAIRLDDGYVAERHCSIQLSGDGRAILTDLASRSGTFVNGIPVTERELKPGDEIAVGETVFLFEQQYSQSEQGTQRPLELSDQESLNVRALESDSGELLALSPESLASLPRDARLDRNLRALSRICRGLVCLSDEESLPWQLLSMTFDMIPATRGAILFLEEASSDVRSQVAWDRASGPDQPVHVNRAIVHRVIAECVSLMGDLMNGGTGAATKSRCSFLCAPLVFDEKPIGVIYLESAGAETPLSEDDLHLLTAIAGLGAVAVENARQFDQLDSENRRLRAEAILTHDMVGRSARMREVYQFIERVAPTDSTVLIHGESGTGKELVANAIHKNSARRNQPFVALNCAAITETLLESELFGHEKGAFTSAVSQKKGFLEVAEGGTIFLDEIGELSLVLQAKLLRVLQEREFVRVGGTRPIKMNVRFLAATNKDLQKLSREEKFRADLFHRLNVISIILPALREHREDIPALAEYFAARHARNCSRAIAGITQEALACLAQYDWPGNIRELENALERAVVIGTSDYIQAHDLPESIAESAKNETAAPAKYHDAIRGLKKQLILGALDQCAGNVTEAAKLLGVHANYLHRLMSNLALRAVVKKPAAD
jgi:Nif-specific regulatory protein